MNINDIKNFKKNLENELKVKLDTIMKIETEVVFDDNLEGCSVKITQVQKTNDGKNLISENNFSYNVANYLNLQFTGSNTVVSIENNKIIGLEIKKSITDLTTLSFLQNQITSFFIAKGLLVIEQEEVKEEVVEETTETTENTED